jgi:hypothetical protein
MKTLIISICFICGGIAFTHAQDTTQSEYSLAEPQIVNEKIETRELPEAVKQALQGQDYRGWLINAVYKAPIVNPGDSKNINKAMYVVELINGNQKKTIEFDKDGKKLNDSEDDR